MKPLYITLLTIVILLVTASFLVAQPPPPLLPSDPSQAPIDGGLSLLAAAGGAYAYKKFRSKQK